MMTIRRAFLSAGLVVALAALTGCTSFAFAGKEGAGSAPADLMDKEISSFYLDKTEVTVAAYKRCVDASVCRKLPSLADEVLGQATHPVVGVTWYDADRFCKWVKKRLPTEAEWEYAARTPNYGPYPWKGKFDATAANSRGATDGYETTAPVGSFPSGATQAGLLDMVGNAAEWTADWYDGVYYQTGGKKNPKGPSLNTGYKSVRGGSWSDNDYQSRTTARDSLDPNFGKNSVGFRCAKGK
jgi:formylglycine-generating enzyme required for sulfatase activity